jgi:multicomponent Na+:H+ antiporter subunit A
MLLVAPLVAILVGLAAPALRRVAGRGTGWLLAVVPLVLAMPALQTLPYAIGEHHLARVSWVESLGVDLAIHLDGLSGVFVLLICGIGALILVYSEGYLAGSPRIGRVQGALLVFLGSCSPTT